MFTVGADVTDDGQELAETSGSSGEKTLQTSDEAKDEKVGHSDALSASMTQTSACLKAHTATADDDEDVHIKDECDSGDTGLSTIQARMVQDAEDSAGSTDDDEEANEDLSEDSDDDNDDKEQVRSLSRPVDVFVLLHR